MLKLRGLTGAAMGALLSLSRLTHAGDAPPPLTLLNQIQQRHIEVQQRVAPAVVAVESSWIKNVQGKPVSAQSYGAGVVLTPEGLILTSFSACPRATVFRPDDEAQTASVYFSNGRMLPVKFVADDPATETRLLQVIPSGAARMVFDYLELADSSLAQVGDLAYTAGNPHRTISQDRQVAWSTGTISGIYTLNPASRRLANRESRYRGLTLETDAAVNQGSDGGPLVDANGRLLGMLSLSYSESRWLGSAVPAHLIKQAYPQILANLKLVAPNDTENGRNAGLRAARAVEVGLTLASQQAQKAMVKLFVQRKPTEPPTAEEEEVEAVAEQKKPGLALELAIRHRPDCPVSGVLIDPSGLVLTSVFNVNDDSGDKDHPLPIKAQLSDGKTWLRVRQMGRNLGQDVCLLQLLPLDGQKMPNLEKLFIPLAKDPNLREGRFVTVLGFSEDSVVPTRTMGIVSAMGRLDDDVVQTDALINYGNSGGAVVDLLGRLVGIASHVKTNTFWSLPNTGVGFFAESDKILPTLADLGLGLDLGDVRKKPRPFPGFTVDETQPEYQGVKIGKIEVDGLAYKARLVVGDIILHVDGFDTPNGPTLVEVLKAHAPGNTVFIEGVRLNADGKLKGFATTLELK